MITAHIETILVVTGLVTALAIGLFVAPRRMLKFAFGLEAPQPVTILMARHWGLLIFLIGVLLVYAAFHPGVRAPAMIIGAVEKLIFAGLVFLGDMPKNAGVKPMAVMDSGIAVLYLMHFAGL
jgi:hypothetical protein